MNMYGRILKYISAGVILFSFFSCEEIFFEPKLEDEKVVIIAPQDGVQIEDTSITFNWDEIENVENYRVQIAQPNFTEATQLIEDTLVNTNKFSRIIEVGQYAWRVRAENSGSQSPYTLAAFQVTENINFNQRTVRVLAPNNNLITNATTLAISWSSVSETTLYRLELLNAEGQVLETQTTNTTQLEVAVTEEIERWQIRAEKGDEFTRYTTQNISVDATEPNTPVNTVPINGTTVSVLRNTFSWTRNPIVGSVEKDSLYIYKDNALSMLELKQEAVSGVEITLEQGTFYWNVKSFDAAGNESNTSQAFSLNIN